MSRRIVGIAGKRLVLSNLEKELYPAYGFTKAAMLEYYESMADYILPHLGNRALTLKRYPDGVEGDFFFEKRCPSYRPEWVKTADIPQGSGERMRVCLVNNAETLAWAANLASLELHVPLNRAVTPETSDSVVFDLDPGSPADIIDCGRVALILRELLADLGLSSYVKTSGKKGLHVYVALNSPDVSFDHTKKFSKAVAIVMQRNYPGLVTARMSKGYRNAKVFINWSQNDSSKTMICIYSLRAAEKPYVSFPLEWKELKRLTGRRDPEKFQVLPAEAVRRVAKYGDLFRDLLSIKQRLPHL